jgi:hypothetical protein
MSNEDLFDAAVVAIRALFADSSVTPGETRRQMKALIEEIEDAIVLLDDKEDS